MVSRRDIEKVIEKKREVYRADYHQMIADFRNEKATAEGYNGRQLLELIQNCDDEKADTVLIELDQERRLLRISNTGRPFSLAGYRSLGISNLSAKTSKRAYIGNKGLGFRSILTWSSAVRIYSNEVCLHYSDGNRRKAFSELIEPELANKIREEQNFRQDEVPFAFLAVPEITDWYNSGLYTTCIELEYKSDYEEDILTQLRSLKSETLLFLHHLKQINLRGVEGCKDLCAEKVKHQHFSKDSFSPYQRVTINGETWSVFQKEEVLGPEFTNERNEPEYYQVKLAIKEEGGSENPLYAFFPTRIFPNFPYVLHATFDLDQNRNHVNNTAKNKRVASELATLIIETALFYTRSGFNNWKPLSLIAYNERNSELEETGFYEKLDEAIGTEALYPCIDGNYRRQDQVYHVAEEFAQFLLGQGWEGYFSNHVLPDGPKFIDVNSLYKNISDSVARVELIASFEMAPAIRANLIMLCLEYISGRKFSILIDEQGRVIERGTDIFTPPTEDLYIPDGYKIVSMSRALFEELTSIMGLRASPEKSREIQRRLKAISNVHAYEPMDLAEKIISLTRKKLQEQDENTHPAILREMVCCLFKNYVARSMVSGQGIEVQVPLLTHGGTLENAKELCFSASYHLGQITSDLFSSVYPDTAFIARPEAFGLQQEDPEAVRNFFEWLAVNDFAVYSSKTLSQSTREVRDYIQELSAKHFTTVHTVHSTTIKYFDEILQKLSPEQFLLWVARDEKLQSLLKGGSQDRYRGANQRQDRSTPLTFVRWKIRQSPFNFETHLLESTLTWLNSITIDYRASVFVANGLGRSAVNHALSMLGAKDEFIDLDIDAVTKILDELPNKYPEGKNVQAIYKRAVDHFVANDEPLSGPIQLFAQDAESLKPYPQEKIYFSDRSNVPRQLRVHYPMLNYPSRSGAVRAIEFFEINDLKEVEIKPVNIRPAREQAGIFEAKFGQLKPFILALRIAGINTQESKKLAARKLNQVTFHLCEVLDVETEHGTYPMEDFEFIPHLEGNYYIKIRGGEPLDHLLRQSLFMDAFADSLCHAFDVRTDRNEYRLMLMRPISDVQHTVAQSVGEHEITEANSLLKYSEPESEFLPALFKFKKIEPTSEGAKSCIEQLQKLGLPEDYRVQVPKTETELQILQKLFESTGIDILGYNEVALEPLDLSAYHEKNANSYFNSKEGLMRSSLWEHLSTQSVDEQAYFLEYNYELNNHHDFIKMQINRYRFQFAIDPQQLYEAFLSQLPLQIGWSQVQEVLDLEDFKSKNLTQFSIEEQRRIDQSKKLRSLLYFETALETIKNELATYAEPEAEEEKINSTGTSSSVQPGTYDIIPRGKRESRKRQLTGPYVPRETRSDINNKIIGNRSENQVYNHLKKMYGLASVKHAAAMDEGQHYDLAYTPDGWQTTKFVEVKTYTAGKFTLTPEEKQFGENHPSDYEIWLVNQSGEVGPLKDFFPRYSNYLKISEYTFDLPLSFQAEEFEEESFEQIEFDHESSKS